MRQNFTFMREGAQSQYIKRGTASPMNVPNFNPCMREISTHECSKFPPNLHSWMFPISTHECAKFPSMNVPTLPLSQFVPMNMATTCSLTRDPAPARFLDWHRKSSGCMPFLGWNFLAHSWVEIWHIHGRMFGTFMGGNIHVYMWHIHWWKYSCVYVAHSLVEIWHIGMHHECAKFGSFMGGNLAHEFGTVVGGN